MDNKTTALGVGIAVLTVGLGYLGYTVMNNQQWESVNVEKQDNVEEVGSTLEVEAVKKVEKSNENTSLLSRFWKTEFNEVMDTKVEDLENV